MGRRRWASAVLAATVAAGGVACSENEGTAGGASDRCSTATSTLLSAIENGLTINGGGSLRNAQVVRSNDFENVYFVSADLEGPGLDADDDVATWATNSLDGSGPIFSVDAVASEMSDWGNSGATQAGLNMADDGARESARCVMG